MAETAIVSAKLQCLHVRPRRAHLHLFEIPRRIQPTISARSRSGVGMHGSVVTLQYGVANLKNKGASGAIEMMKESKQELSDTTPRVKIS